MMKCAASEGLGTSGAGILEAYSVPIRWNTRSAPERSTRTAMPGYFASKDFAIFSASGRSIEVYQITLPSFFAAAISSGGAALAGGAADSTAVENALPAASALVPISRSRREIENSLIRFLHLSILLCVFSSYWLYPARARQRSGGRCR